VTRPLWPEYTQLFGTHSNIPSCCIETFISGEYLEYGLGVYSIGWSYMPCRPCLEEDNKVKIHHCTLRCIPFLQSIGADNFIKELIGERI